MTPIASDDQTSSSAPGALVLWATDQPGYRSVGRALAGLLAEMPHRLQSETADLPAELAGRSLIPRVAAFFDRRLERSALAAMGWEALGKAIAAKPPRVVVVLDPLAAAVVDAWRAKGLLRAPVVGVLCSLRTDPLWAQTAVDRLVVIDELQATQAQALGLPASCLVPRGMPICGGFSAVDPSDRESLRRRYQLPERRPVVLVVAHGFTADQLSGMLFQLSLVAERATLIIDVARAESVADLLRSRAQLYDVQAQMFGKVEQGPELWGAASLVVARPFSYIEQRALTLRLPLVCLPQDELERQLARAYVERGVGASVEKIASLAAQIETLLSGRGAEEAAAALAQITRRSATADIARVVAQVAANAEAILAEGRESASSFPAATAAQAAAARSPLEQIGGPAAGRTAASPAAPSLAELELGEEEADALVTAHQQELERWERRLALAADRGEAELEQLASREVERHRGAMHRALAELARLAEVRQQLGRAPAGEGADALERSFRRLEVEQALAELKRER